MTFAAFTIDVDRDVNLPLPGRMEASSMEGAEGARPRFTSSRRGLELLVDLLDEWGIKGTFFIEARTAKEVAKDLDLSDLVKGHEIGCHGFEHEDLTGERTGLPVSMDDVFFIMEGARGVLADATGQDVSGFRAPYLQVNDDILGAIDEVGFSYDSSITVDITKGSARPWRLSSGLLEVPLAKGVDSEGRSIHSYLWAMHEGKRQPEDYLEMMRGREETFLVLATHSWHLVETFSDGMLNDNEIERGLDQLGSVLEGAREAGVEFVTIEEFIRRIDS